MPAVAPVPGSVTPKGQVAIRSATTGEAVTEGAVIYLSGGLAYKADSSTAAKATAVGIAVTPAASGDVVYYTSTQLMIMITGGTFTKNEWYIVSGTAGVIEQLSDASAGEYVTYLGIGDDDGNLTWNLFVTGQTKA